jgi:hypothetical protein
MALMDVLRRYSLIIGVVGLCGVVLANLMASGTVERNVVNLVSVFVLLAAAVLSKQKMFAVLQMVFALAAVLNFAGAIPEVANYVLYCLAGLLGVVYLIKTGYAKEDEWWPLGSLGLAAFVFGMASPAGPPSMLVNALFYFGSAMVILYSCAKIIFQKAWIAGVWLILNLAFIFL